MDLCFLGTGTSQGVPVIACHCEVCRSTDKRDKRLRTSIFVSYEGKQFVIDTGPDFRQQMLREKIEHLDFVLLTHEHKDHVAGLDDIRSFNFSQHSDMDVFGNERTCEAVANEFFYAFEKNKYPGVPRIKLHSVCDEAFEIKGIRIQPVQVLHFKMNILGYRIGKMAYITDASFLAERELKKLKGLKVLIINALRKEKHYSHFNLEEALQVIDKVQADKAYLTHISHTMGLYKKIQPELPENVYLAYDGLRVHIED